MHNHKTYQITLRVSLKLMTNHYNWLKLKMKLLVSCWFEVQQKEIKPNTNLVLTKLNICMSNKVATSPCSFDSLHLGQISQA